MYNDKVCPSLTVSALAVLFCFIIVFCKVGLDVESAKDLHGQTLWASRSVAHVTKYVLGMPTLPQNWFMLKTSVCDLDMIG